MYYAAFDGDTAHVCRTGAVYLLLFVVELCLLVHQVLFQVS